MYRYAVFEHLPPHPFAKISTEGIALGDIRALHGGGLLQVENSDGPIALESGA
jgi:hypothetical protein